MVNDEEEEGMRKNRSRICKMKGSIVAGMRKSRYSGVKKPANIGFKFFIPWEKTMTKKLCYRNIALWPKGCGERGRGKEGVGGIEGGGEITKGKGKGGNLYLFEKGGWGGMGGVVGRPCRVRRRMEISQKDTQKKEEERREYGAMTKGQNHEG